MSRPEYKVLLDKTHLRSYVKQYNVDPYFIGFMDGAENIVEIAPEWLARVSRHILNFGNSDYVYSLAEDYGAENLSGEEFIEVMTGHIADDILANCCRTVFELN